MKLNKTKYIELLEYFLAFLLWLSIPPYFLWQIENLKVYLLLLFVAISFLICKKISQSNLSFFLLIGTVYTFFSFRNGGNIFGLLDAWLICFILLLPKDFLYRIFNKLIKLYAILLIPSIVIYILVIIFGFSLPHDIIQPLVKAKNYLYFQYPSLVVPNTLNEGFSYFRFHAWFDEPGVIGTISGIFLLINRINFKRWEFYPIIISGILSMSITFFILLFISIILFQPLKIKIIMIVVFIVIGIYSSENGIIENLVFNRLTIENGRLAGDNRTQGSMDNFMEEFWHSDKVLWGYGNNYSNVVNFGGASYKDLIVDNGIFGFLIFCISSLFFAYINLRFSKQFLIYIIIFGSIIYQRPFINHLIYFVFIFISIFYLKHQKSENNIYQYE